MDLVQSMAFIYAAVVLIFTLGFLINWYRNREAISAYKRIGFWGGIIYVSFELLTLALSGGTLFGIGSMCFLIVIALGWGILRVWGFVNNGIFFSNQLNLRSFPLVAPRLGAPSAPGGTSTVDPMSITMVEGLTPIASPPFTTDAAPPTPIDWPRYWLTIVGVGVGAVAYSAVLFLITQPRPGLIAQSILSTDVQIITPLTLVVILEFAFVEELIFRLGIQNYLGAKLVNRRYGYAIAVALTAALWSMAHVGSLDPDWVKLAQIFPLGLALGWLYRRQGTESTIMAHALFNLLGGLLLSPLYLR
jgi:membrane protease YdiL (CAAX protease family)